MKIEDIFDTDILGKYEFHDYGHALEILSGSFPEELDDLRYCLKNFTIMCQEVPDFSHGEEWHSNHIA